MSGTVAEHTVRDAESRSTNLPIQCTSDTASTNGTPLVHEGEQSLEDRAAASRTPPCDRGPAAWSFLAAASATIMITWGHSAAFGVFREYYFRHPPFAGNQSIAHIGVLGIGILQATAPVLIRYLSGRPNKRKPLMWLGMLVIVASSIGAAFSRTPIQVITTQGVLYGLGGGLLFAPSLCFIEEWFVQRISLANGLYFAASSAASGALSPSFSFMLAKYGPRNTLLGWSIIAVVVLSIAILCIRSRLGNGIVEKSPKIEISYVFFKKPLFWLLALSTVMQALAHYLPPVYLPTYATDLGTSTQNASLLLTYFNVACIICQPLLGALTDTCGVALPLFLSTFVGSASTFILWGLGRSYWTLTLFVLLFGGFSGAYVVFRSHFARAIVGQHQGINAGNQELIVSSVLMLLRGTATVSSGFVGKAAVEGAAGLGIRPGYGAGKWRILIVVIGSFMAAAALGVVGFFRRGRRAENKGEDEEAA